MKILSHFPTINIWNCLGPMPRNVFKSTIFSFPIRISFSLVFVDDKALLFTLSVAVSCEWLVMLLFKLSLLLSVLHGTFSSSLSDWVSHLPKISPEGAIERFLNALDEYYEAGGLEAVTRGLEINEGSVLVERRRVFGLEDALASQWNVTCFRIPAVVQTDTGLLLAFAEARIDTCADCAELGIAMKRSEDGGQTWSDLTWPVPPTATGPGHEMARGGNPTVVYDTLRRQVVLHFNRGTSDPDGDGHYDCIPAVDNFQIISGDGGLSWGPVTNISQFLGQ